MIELYLKKYDCCGCSACCSICPQAAISMQPDEEGFLYPKIDVNKCTECNLCKEVCAFQKGYKKSDNYKTPLVYAVKHISDAVRNTSSSGGMFTALSDEILSRNGVVYGVGCDEQMVVCHQRATDAVRRDTFRGSKYVQSEIRLTFKEIQTDLKKGLPVIFTGTPCQTAALRKILDKVGLNTEKLIVCDLVCHGVPSPLIYSEYLKYCEKKKGNKIKQHIFRSKVAGWHGHTEMNVFEDGTVDHKSYSSQIYKEIFHRSMAMRPACHKCVYTNLRRPSDLTIADYWGIEKFLPDFDDNKGISLVLINTPKGQKIFENLKTTITFKESEISKCLQPQLQYPNESSPLRDIFWDDYRTRRFKYVIEKYTGYGIINRIKIIIRGALIKISIMNIVNKMRQKGE